jgi:hypothetical protein
MFRRRIANSSPPIRETADCLDPLRRELLRTLALQASGHTDEHLVARGMPEIVVDQFESIQIHEQDGEQAALLTYSSIADSRRSTK